MDKEINRVLSTLDYAKFKFLASNRDLRLPHIEELKQSIKDCPLDKPIDVNENHEIIDGQHGYYAWQELGMPIIYIVHKGWGEKEVPILNTNQKNWNPSDFVKMYIQQGSEDYKQYHEFSQRFGFTHMANLILMSGGSKQNKASKDFNEGKFRVKKWMWANIIAKQIIEFSQFYPGYKRSAFVSAYVQLAMDSNFEHTLLMDRVQSQQRKMVDCTTVGEYYELLREIYNFRTRNNKITVQYTQ